MLSAQFDLMVKHAEGRQNPRYDEVLINFSIMLSFYGERVYSMVAGNIPLPTFGHIKRIRNAKVKNGLLLDASQENLKARLLKLYETCKTTKVVVSMSFDATVAVPALQLSHKYSVFLGLKEPNSFIPLDSLPDGTDLKEYIATETRNGDALAKEVKAVVLMLHNVKSRSPMYLLCLRPQGKNEPGHEFNEKVVSIWYIVNFYKMLEIFYDPEIMQKFQLVSVCTDGVSYEHQWIFTHMRHKLVGEDTPTFFIDDNHVAKAIRGQLIYATVPKFIGKFLLNPMPLTIAKGLKIDTISPKDYSSDFRVNDLCSSESIESVLAISQDDIDVSIIAINLIFLKMFICSTNYRKLDWLTRITFKWLSCNWFMSINGLSKITKKNIALNLVGSILNYCNTVVENPRYCTEEPCEHLFGMFRTKNREATVKEFVELADSVENFWNASVKSGLNPGTGKGYIQSLKPFMDFVHKSNTDQAIVVVNETESNRQEIAFKRISECNQFLKNVFVQFSVTDEELSPFVQYNDSLSNMTDNKLLFLDSCLANLGNEDQHDLFCDDDDDDDEENVPKVVEASQDSEKIDKNLTSLLENCIRSFAPPNTNEQILESITEVTAVQEVPGEGDVTTAGHNFNDVASLPFSLDKASFRFTANNLFRFLVTSKGNLDMMFL